MSLLLTLAFLFFIGSVLGWVLELLFRNLTQHPDKLVNPGFCTGPWLPIYGFGLCALYLLASLEKTKRDQLIPLLESWTALLEEALACRSGMRALHPMTRTIATQRSSQELMQAIAALQKTTTYAQSNVSPAAICGYLTWQLR